MGRVTAAVKVENLIDIYAVERGDRAPESARLLDVPDAVVDPGKVHVSIPEPLATELGAPCPARVTVMDRDFTCDVRVAPDGFPVTLGHLVLTALDLVIDSTAGCLISNPAHGGQWTLEAY